MYYMYYFCYTYYYFLARCLKSIGSQIVYELDHRKPVLFVIPVEHILETSSCTSWLHRNDSAPPAQLVSSRIWRPQAGCWRWMQDVVCQLVGNGVVPWHVMNEKGSSASVRHLTPLWCAGLSQLLLWHLWLLLLLCAKKSIGLIVHQKTNVYNSSSNKIMTII